MNEMSYKGGNMQLVTNVVRSGKNVSQEIDVPLPHLRAAAQSKCDSFACASGDSFWSAVSCSAFSLSNCCNKLRRHMANWTSKPMQCRRCLRMHRLYALLGRSVRMVTGRVMLLMSAHGSWIRW